MCCECRRGPRASLRELGKFHSLSFVHFGAMSFSICLDRCLSSYLAGVLQQQQPVTSSLVCSHVPTRVHESITAKENEIFALLLVSLLVLLPPRLACDTPHSILKAFIALSRMCVSRRCCSPTCASLGARVSTKSVVYWPALRYIHMNIQRSGLFLELALFQRQSREYRKFPLSSRMVGCRGLRQGKICNITLKTLYAASLYGQASIHRLGVVSSNRKHPLPRC